MEASTDDEGGVVAAVAEVGVAEAAFELDAVADPATQAKVGEIAIIVRVEGAGDTYVDLDISEPSDEGEGFAEVVVPAKANRQVVDVDILDALGRILGEREPVLAKPIEPRRPKPSAD